MSKNFVFAEELIDDDGFRDWYFKRNTPGARDFETWLQSSAQNRTLGNEASELINAMDLAEENVLPSQLEVAKERLFNAIGKTELETVPVVKMKNNRLRNYWAAAAAVILVASAGIWLLLGAKTKQAINSSYGQITESSLPDGSTVTLNANSTVTLSDGWDKNKDREVWVEGEAFFKVKKTENKQRFIVHTERFDIIVTGTQFNVVNRSGKTAVLLQEGSVTLRSNDGKQVFMNPGEYFEYAGNKNEIEKKDVKEINVLAWKKKELVFENTTLSEVATILKQHYGVDVLFADEELKQSTITCILPNNNLEMLMESMEATMEFKIQRKGNELIIAKP